MRIVVMGGLGLIGRAVVTALRGAGHDAIAASRATGVDLLTGAGLPDVLVGAHTVIDVTNAPSLVDRSAAVFFATASGNLLEAEKVAGVRHHLALSVVGTARIEGSNYFDGKASQERQIRDSGIAFTIVRATQFFEFLVGIIEAAVRDQSVQLSPAAIQPVASTEVAMLIAELAGGQPRHGAIEVAGPERERMDELVGRFVRDIGAPCDIVRNPSAPYFGAVLDADTLLPGADARIASCNFSTWFARSEFSRSEW